MDDTKFPVLRKVLMVQKKGREVSGRGINKQMLWQRRSTILLPVTNPAALPAPVRAGIQVLEWICWLQQG